MSTVVASVMAPDKTPPDVNAVPVGRDDPVLREYTTAESDGALSVTENATVFITEANVEDVLHAGNALKVTANGFTAAVPSVLITNTPFVPDGLAASCAIICVDDTIVGDVTATVPMRTKAPALKPDPVILIYDPPEVSTVVSSNAVPAESVTATLVIVGPIATISLKAAPFPYKRLAVLPITEAVTLELLLKLPVSVPPLRGIFPAICVLRPPSEIDIFFFL